MQWKAAFEEQAARPGGERIEIFQYPTGPHAFSDASGGETSWAETAWNGFGEAAGEQAGAEPVHSPSASELHAEFERRLQEETRRAFEAGREQSRQEEQRRQGVEQLAVLERQKQHLAALAETFYGERDRYLRAVEQEVVKLALAVAARILRREAQMDPLLLTGAVRVALGQLAATTEVHLHVPPADLDLWTEAIALLPNLPVKPSVLGCEGMRLGDCRVETRLGTVDLGIRSQLGEIERGFFDRAGMGRPLPPPKPEPRAPAGREPIA
jgi:flagellar biosynthesis/type III secretory pathway protein FliH